MKIVHHIFRESKSKYDFFRRLHDAGLTPTFDRRGMPVGFKDAAGIRFKYADLGIMPYHLETLESRYRDQQMVDLQKRLTEIEKVRGKSADHDLSQER